ncbi:MAG TPA: SLC13 family permease [Planctomycetota bacterium]|nr:SLC13 family permease [Planctomycetota bacterium]
MSEKKGVFASFELREWIGLFLGPALFCAVGFLLKAKGLNASAAWAGATVVLMATWWITEPIPLWATACLPIVLFPVLCDLPIFPLLLQYVDPINFLFLGGMLIAASMEQWGLHRRIALEIIGRVGTGPRRIVLGFMMATAFISLWISNTAAAVMLFPICMAVIVKFQDEVGSQDALLRQFGLSLMLGLAYAASIGGIGTKIGTGTNLVFVKMARQTLNIEIDFVTWLKFGMPVVLICIPVVWIYLVRFAAPLPADGFQSGQRAIHEARSKLGPLSAGERAALVAFLTAATLWIFRKPIELGFATIPGWWQSVPFGWPDLLGSLDQYSAPLRNYLKQDFGDGAVAMVVSGVLFFIPVQKKPLRAALGPKEAAGISWGLLVMLGGGFAMAYGIQESKLSDWIAAGLQGKRQLHPFFATLLVCIVATVLTEVASNTATASILLPLLATSAESMGLHPVPLMLAATLAASFGFMLPAGTPPNAVAFSSGYITVPQMARCGLMVDILGIIVVTPICTWWVPWVLNIK